MADEKTTENTDWARIERDFFAGIKSVRQIAAENGLSEGAIRKWAIRNEHTRSMAAKVLYRAEELVRTDEVRSEYAHEQASGVTESAVVEANAEMLANVIRGHRKDAGKLRGVVAALLEKVTATVTEAELFGQIGEIIDSGDDIKAKELFNKVISLPSQTDTTRKLAETMKVLVELERKIFKLETVETDPVEAAAKGAAAGATAAFGEYTRTAIADLERELSRESA